MNKCYIYMYPFYLQCIILSCLDESERQHCTELFYVKENIIMNLITSIYLDGCVRCGATIFQIFQYFKMPNLEKKRANPSRRMTT